MENRKETTAAPTPQVDYDDMAEAIDGVLSAVPMTAAEINAALGTDYEALQVANAVKSIPGAGACKIRRMTTNIRGETGRRRPLSPASGWTCRAARFGPKAGAQGKSSTFTPPCGRNQGRRIPSLCAMFSLNTRNPTP